MPIDDIYGSAVKEGDALVVTEDTLPNGRKINERRQEQGREPLELIIVDRLRDEAGDVVTDSGSTRTEGPVRDEAGGVVSSSRIRAGEIDVDGFLQ